MSSVQVGMILYEGEQVMYSESSEAFVLRQPKAHGSLKGLQETRLVFSIQKSLSVTIGTICESVCTANYCSHQAPGSSSSVCLSFFLHVLPAPPVVPYVSPLSLARGCARRSGTGSCLDLLSQSDRWRVVCDDMRDRESGGVCGIRGE
jgi:hypothetical protein